jgi:hypothetical protein
MDTLSEQLFEQLCDARSVRWERIATTPDSQTPDYAVWLGTVKVIVEVKQLELSEADHRAIRALSQGVSLPSAFKSTAHSRVRNLIRPAGKQLKVLAKGVHPSFIVLFDNTRGFSTLDFEDILNAMYGDEAVTVNWSNVPGEKPAIVGHHFGGHRKMTPAHNRSVSGLGLLSVDRASGQPSVAIFHNIHAAIPLPPEVAAGLAARQYTLDKDGMDRYQSWREIIHTSGT